MLKIGRVQKVFASLLIGTGFLICSAFSPQSEPVAPNGNQFVKDIEKKMIKIGKYLYVSKYETSLIEWKLFISEMKAKGENVAGYDYNQSAWLQFPWTETDPMVKTYFTKSQYKTYPILNITHDGAEKYCAWLTEKYIASGGKAFKNPKFVLPTDEQWCLAAGVPKGKSLPFKASKLQDEGGRYYGNVKYEDPVMGGTKYDVDGIYIVTNVNNTRFGGGSVYGLVHIFGNVAEMIDIDGQAKGGSWENFMEECGINKNQLYSGPDPRVGFRVFLTGEMQ